MLCKHKVRSSIPSLTGTVHAHPQCKHLTLTYSLCWPCTQKPLPEQNTSPELISQLLFLSISLYTCKVLIMPLNPSTHGTNPRSLCFCLQRWFRRVSMKASLTAICKPIWMRETGQDWVCFADDALSRLEISSCFLQMFFFREASKAYSGSHRVSGSSPAKAHQHLKTFSSVSAAEGSWLQFKKKPTRWH